MGTRRHVEVGRWVAAVGALGVAALLVTAALGGDDDGRPDPLRVDGARGGASLALADGGPVSIEPTRVRSLVPTGDQVGDGAADPTGVTPAPSEVTSPPLTREGSGRGVTSSTTTPTSSTTTEPDAVPGLPLDPAIDLSGLPDLTGAGGLEALLDPLLGLTTTTTTAPGTSPPTLPFLGLPLSLTPPSTVLPPLLPGG